MPARGDRVPGITHGGAKALVQLKTAAEGARPPPSAWSLRPDGPTKQQTIHEPNTEPIEIPQRAERHGKAQNVCTD